MTEKKREIPPRLLSKTVDILRKRFNTSDIAIDSIDVLSGDERRNVLLRIKIKSASDTVPKSFILKQSLPQPNDPDEERAKARFSRDWAGLEFASKMQEKEGTHYTPLFYDSDHEDRFILIEDLGSPHVSLVDSLAPAVPNPDKAIAALHRYVQALGRFNAASFDKTDDYDAILKRIDNQSASVQEDLDAFSKELQPSLKANVNALGLEVTPALEAEVQQVLNSVYLSEHFNVLTHGDIALDNVFDHEQPKGLQLIDFEHASPRSALVDGVYLRMSMPTGWFAKSIPNDILKPLELMYRTELQKGIAKASNDVEYSTAYTHACAYYLLRTMTVIGAVLEKDKPWGDAGRDPVPEDSLWNSATNTLRPRLLTRLQTFIEVVAEHDSLSPKSSPILPHLRTLAEEMLTKVQKLWPESKPLEYFPAFFKEDALHLDAATSKVAQSTSTQKFKSVLSEMHNEPNSVDNRDIGTDSSLPNPTAIKPKLIQ